MEVETTGIPPVARFAHTACAIEGSLYIYGGRNEKLKPRMLSDVNIFNVASLKWEKVDVSGERPEGRWGHSMCSYNDQVMVLGGINHSSFMGSQLYILFTNKQEAIQLKYENRLKKL